MGFEAAMRYLYIDYVACATYPVLVPGVDVDHYIHDLPYSVTGCESPHLGSPHTLSVMQKL